MELSCPFGIKALSRKENLSCSGVLSASLFGQDGWIFVSFIFCLFMGHPCYHIAKENP